MTDPSFNPIWVLVGFDTGQVAYLEDQLMQMICARVLFGKKTRPETFLGANDLALA